MTLVEILIAAKAQVDAAFNAVVSKLGATEKASKKTQEQTDRTNKSFNEMSQRAGKVSDALSRTSTSLARSADAFGLPVQALRTLDDVADVAAMGFENLTKSTAGFNAASIGVAGAGLAIGTAIGTWLRTFPEVEEAADKAGAAIMRLFGVNAQSANEAAAATANWAIEQKKIAAAYEELQRKLVSGKTAKEAQAILFPEPPKNIRETILDEIKLREEKAKKAQELALKEAMGFDAANKKAEADHAASLDRQLRDEERYVDLVIKESWRLEKEIEKVAQAMTDARVKAILDAALEEQEANESNLQRARESAEEMGRVMEEAYSHRFDGLADSLHQVVDVMDSLGISAESGLGKIAGLVAGTADMIAAAAQRGFFTIADLVNQASQIFKSGSILGGAASGAMTGNAIAPGGIGAAIGAIAGGLLGLFGKAKQAREEMKKLSDQFVSSQGGMEALKRKAQEAGIALDAMFKAKSATQLQAAIAGIKSQLDLWAEGNDKVQAAMDELGLTIDQMGPKWREQDLDKQAGHLAELFGVLAAAGGDVGAISDKIGPKVLDLVKQYQAAGLEIPEALRPVLEAMLANGQLVDENGQAYASLEDAGIKFAATMSQALQTVSDHLQQLIEVLARGFNIPINFSTNGAPSPSGGGGGGGGPHYHGEGGDVPGNAYGGWYPPGQPALRWMGEAGPARSQGELAIPKGMLQQLLAEASSMGAARAAALGAGGGGGSMQPADVYWNGTRVGKQIMRSDTFRRALRNGRRA